jgi:hypothetical protein
VPFFKTVTIQLGAFYVIFAYFVIVGTSNAVNLTDGLDGLAIMPAVMVGAALGIFAYATGNVNFAAYLSIPYISGAGELLVFCARLTGAGLGFLWFNAYPAQVFMGDIGALAIGAAFGAVAVIVRQELVLLVMGGVFVIETGVRHPPGRIVQAHRAAHLQDGAPASPLRAQGVGRAEGDRALLDHHGHPRAPRPRDAQGALMPRCRRTSRDRTRPHRPVGARHLRESVTDVLVMDSRAEPPARAELERVAPDVAITPADSKSHCCATRRSSSCRQAFHSVCRSCRRRARAESLCSAISSCSRVPPARQ